MNSEMNYENEIWKPIKSTDGRYYVSNFGRVRSSIGKIMSQQVSHRGYMRINLAGRQYKVHRLVATCFVDNIYNYSEVNHIDGDKTNNLYTNLEWCTRKYNMNHRVRRWKHRKAVPILQYDNNGAFIRYWPSITKASKTLRISRSDITDCANGKLKFAGGSHFEFATSTNFSGGQLVFEFTY